MTKIHNPPELPAPPTYSHGIEVPANWRTVYVAGQVGVDRDGNAPAGIKAQSELAWAAVRAVLRSAGMDLKNVVKTTVYLKDPADYAEFVKVRSAVLGDTKPASTLVYISGLARPDFIVEVDATAVGP